MKTIATSLALLFFQLGYAQNYEIKSIPTYDQDGNMYQVVSRYDYPPTTEDSVKFFESSKLSIHLMIDSVQKTLHPVYHKKSEYPVIVGAVRITKRGTVTIRPLTKRNTPWYRYPHPEVKVGDTIWISRNDAIEPRF